MEIVLAEEYGFCFGVRRAIGLAEKAVASNNRVATLGAIIHNPLEVERLNRIGLRTVESIDELEPGEVVLIRSHGVSVEVLKELKKRNIKIINATCPLVARAQGMVSFLTSNNYNVIIIGEKGHPEVEGLLSFGNGRARIIASKEEIDLIPLDKNIGVISQTTFSFDRFREILGEIVRKGWEIRVFNTLCDASQRRQRAMEKLSESADVIIVIGGKNSANTRRLAEIGWKRGIETHHIESWEEVDPRWFHSKEKIGITAGASTPDWVINKVIEKINKICFQ
ncbi:MAG: 4-hydroxy-3-methylbut-2-enyl diphosphate reductase [bacterium]